MRLVVSRVQVLAIPAAREEDLSTQTIWAVDEWEPVRLRSRRCVVVEAGVADGLSSECAGVVADKRVTGNHSESSREGLECVVVGTGTLEIVDSGATKGATTITSLRNSLERSVLELKVQFRSPVGWKEH